MAIEGVEFEIRVTHVQPEADNDGWVEVALVGEFDVATAPGLRERLVAPEVSGASDVRVDLFEASFVDSTTISLLIVLCKRVRKGGGHFSVSCGDGPAFRVLEISGLVDYLEVQSPA